MYVFGHSPLVLRKTVALIEAAGLAKVIGMTNDATLALHEIRTFEPHVVLLDLHLRVGSGIDVVASLT